MLHSYILWMWKRLELFLRLLGGKKKVQNILSAYLCKGRWNIYKQICHTKLLGSKFKKLLMPPAYGERKRVTGSRNGRKIFFLSNILHIFKFWTMWILPTFKSKEIKIIIKKLRQENSYKMMEYGNAEKKGNSPRKPLLHVPSALLSLPNNGLSNLCELRISTLQC